MFGPSTSFTPPAGARSCCIASTWPSATSSTTSRSEAWCWIAKAITAATATRPVQHRDHRHGGYRGRAGVGRAHRLIRAREAATVRECAAALRMCPGPLPHDRNHAAFVEPGPGVEPAGITSARLIPPGCRRGRIVAADSLAKTRLHCWHATLLERVDWAYWSTPTEPTPRDCCVTGGPTMESFLGCSGTASTARRLHVVLAAGAARYACHRRRTWSELRPYGPSPACISTMPTSAFCLPIRPQPARPARPPGAGRSGFARRGCGGGGGQHPHLPPGREGLPDLQPLLGVVGRGWACRSAARIRIPLLCARRPHRRHRSPDGRACLGRRMFPARVENLGEAVRAKNCGRTGAAD